MIFQDPFQALTFCDSVVIQPWSYSAAACSQIVPLPTAMLFTRIRAICSSTIYKNTGRRGSCSQIQFFYHIFCVCIFNGNSCTHCWDKSSMADSERSPQGFENVVSTLHWFLSCFILASYVMEPHSCWTSNKLEKQSLCSAPGNKTKTLCQDYQLILASRT